MARSFSSSATGHQMILRASASGHAHHQLAAGAARGGEENTGGGFVFHFGGLNRPRADFAPGEPPKGQEEEGTPEDKQGGSVVQGAAVGIRKRGGAECDVREREEQRGHHAGDAGKRQDHDPEQHAVQQDGEPGPASARARRGR